MAFGSGKQRAGTNKYAGGQAWLRKVDFNTGADADTQWWLLGILKEHEIDHATPMENDYDVHGDNYPNPGNTTSIFNYTLMQVTESDLTLPLVDTTGNAYAILISYSKTKSSSSGTKYLYVLYPYVQVEGSLKQKRMGNTIPMKLVASPAIATYTAADLNGLSGYNGTLTTALITCPSGQYLNPFEV